MLQVLPGARIPADGVVHQGTAFVDESMITGITSSIYRESPLELCSNYRKEGSYSMTSICAVSNCYAQL